MKDKLKVFLDKTKVFLGKVKEVSIKFYHKAKKTTIELYNKLKAKYIALAPDKRKKLIIICSSVLAGIILLSVIIGIAGGKKPDDNNNNNNNNNTPSITLSTAVVESLGEITTAGGVIEITDNDSAVNGLRISVEAGSYSMPVNFQVKSYQVINHNLGDNFNPITPLIEINNNHEFSNAIIKVRIPIELGTDKFAMGFYYDEITGSLEAIPTLELTSDSITLGVKHFSKIIVSDIPLSVLQTLTAPSTSAIDSGFTPAIDDWHYLNYGSAIAPGGHCAGQSLTMSWYYSEKHLKESGPRLYGRFDNNDDTDTPQLWEDDNNAYRFSSVVQNSIDWSSSEWTDFIDYCVDNPRNTFYAFAHAINTTNTPQFMAIFPSAPGMGHAIVAYKVQGNRIYVADPNFPGQTDRYVEFDPLTNKFNPYSSGSNAADINANGAIAYTKIVYVAKTALVDYSFIADNYNKMQNGTVGDDVFPSSDIQVLTKYNDNSSLREWVDYARVINLGTAYTQSLNQQLTGKAVIKVTPNNMFYSLYLNDSSNPEQNAIFSVSGGSIFYEVDLNLGSNEYGLLVEVQIDDDYYYVDFIRIRINYSNSNPSSVITFDSNGGSLVSSITQEVGSALTEPTAPVRSGYDFGGWFIDRALSVRYNFSTMPNSNITLYARWINSDLINKVIGLYYLNTVNGERNLGMIEYYSFEIKADGSFEERFKRFDASVIVDSGIWTLDSGIIELDYGNEYYYLIADGLLLIDLPIEEQIFVFKKHSVIDISVTVNFNSNGGSAVQAISGNPGDVITQPVNPTRDGYYFSGWFSDSALTNSYSFTTFPAKNITLYASWTSSSGNLMSQVVGTYDLTHIGGVGAPNSENTSIVSETLIFDADGTYTITTYRKDTDVVHFSSEWTISGNVVTFGGIDYFFTGTTLTMDSSYPWIYTKRQS